MKLANRTNRTHTGIMVFSLITIVLTFSTISFTFAKNRMIQKTVDETEYILEQVSMSYENYEELGEKLNELENRELDIGLKNSGKLVLELLEEKSFNLEPEGAFGIISYEIIEDNEQNRELIGEKYNMDLHGFQNDVYKTIRKDNDDYETKFERVYVQGFDTEKIKKMDMDNEFILILSSPIKAKVEKTFKNFNTLNVIDNEQFNKINKIGVFYVYDKELGMIFTSDENYSLEESFYSENMMKSVVDTIMSIGDGNIDLSYYRKNGGSTKKSIFSVKYDERKNHFYILEIDKNRITEFMDHNMKILLNIILILYFVYTVAFFNLIKVYNNKNNTSYSEIDDV